MITTTPGYAARRVIDRWARLCRLEPRFLVLADRARRRNGNDWHAYEAIKRAMNELLRGIPNFSSDDWDAAHRHLCARWRRRI